MGCCFSFVPGYSHQATSSVRNFSRLAFASRSQSLPRGGTTALLSSRLVFLALSASLMAPSPWQKRYYRESKKTGKELLLLQKSGKRGIWTAMDPDFRVTSVELKATTETPATGIDYRLVPVPTAGQKAAAMTASSTMVARRVTGAELLPFKSTSKVAIAVALVASLGGPRQIGKLIRWGCKSRRNLATVVALSLASGFV